MITFEAHDILFGVNDMWHFVHETQANKGSSISLQNFLEKQNIKGNGL